MKHRPKICRNCAYCDYNELKIWCDYWKITIGPMAATMGCSRFKPKEEEDYWENVTGL